MKTGIQLWGILKDGKADAVAVLKALRGMGYAHIEPCVSLERIEGYDHVIWPADWLRAHFAEIAGMGLEIRSCHAFAANIAADAPKLADLARELGIRRFVVKTPQSVTDESLQQTAMNYMRAADVLAGAGAELLLHNEVADIAVKTADTTIYEHLLDLCLGRVGAQVDVGWVLAAGEDPEAFLWRNAARVKSLHFKDFVSDERPLRETPPGSGVLDTAACFQFARAHGCDQVVDMDAFSDDPLTDLARARENLGQLIQCRENTLSYLNALDVETGAVRTLAKFDRVIEAPNWLKRSNRILYNADGHIFAFDPDTQEETPIDTGFCDSCNNDHVVSADETAIAVSHMTAEGGFTSRVYVVPFDGGAPRLVTPNTPSFLHGWSPDGGEFAYCAFREIDGQRAVDVYTIPSEGGEEKRLTGEGFNDGPEYAPDGKAIWFNSTRTGLMQIWRMNRDGSSQTQMTFNARNNWFGHISPDGQKVVYLSYGPEDLEPDEHLPNMPVELWMMNADGSRPHRIAAFFGGQGSINVNSWAGDSRHVAFVSYELRHK